MRISSIAELVPDARERIVPTNLALTPPNPDICFS